MARSEWLKGHVHLRRTRLWSLGLGHGGVVQVVYRGTSLMRNHLPLGPYIRTMTRALWGP